MQLRRVVITGLGAVTPYGQGVETLFQALCQGKSAISHAPELAEVKELRPRVAGLIQGIDPKIIHRKFRRAMSKMSIFSVLACQEALENSRLSKDLRTNGRTGVALGSTMGSTETMEEFFAGYLANRSLARTKSTTFFKVVGHTCASNVAQYFGINGRVLAPTAACSTGCQAVGLGFEAIALGRQDAMICGGADEFNALTVGTFDLFQAASHSYNDTPKEVPKPFDSARDGIVCSEGAGVMILESLSSARNRGAEILAEVVGFSSTSDAVNIANPDAGAILRCMADCLEHAGLEPGEVDYVNAHATGTIAGDKAESRAINELFGSKVPVSSLKGHLGHTMAASGGIELCACVDMMRQGCVIPTLNLTDVDLDCRGINHVSSIQKAELDVVLKNNFALGGVNTSIIIKRV